MTTVGVPVRINQVSHVFSGGTIAPVSALQQIDLDVPSGEFLALVGPSGCGKSTLLRLIAGLDRPTLGSVKIMERAELAYVFQDAHLLPWRNVLANVALPLELRGVDKKERERQALEALEPLGLSEFVGAYPASLSGGMKMRVSLARALITKPRLLLMDEPFAALDEVIRFRLAENLRQLWQEKRMTVVFVTHSISEAVFLAERAVVLSRRPGRIVLDRKIDLPDTRSDLVRTDVRFAKESRALYEAFHA